MSNENEAFAEYVTSTAFSLNLSKVQVEIIGFLHVYGVEVSPHAISHRMHHFTTLQALKRKGLVYWKYDAEGRACGFQGLTDAGKKVAELLVLAGLVTARAEERKVA